MEDAAGLLLLLLDADSAADVADAVRDDAEASRGEVVEEEREKREAALARKAKLLEALERLKQAT